MSDLKKKDPRKFLESVLSKTEKKMKVKDDKIEKEVIQKKEKDQMNVSNVNNAANTNISTNTSSSNLNIIPPKITSAKLMMDEQGRVVDEKGNIIQIKPEAKSTLKININKEKEQRVKEMLKSQKIDMSQAKRDKADIKFYDKSLEFLTLGNKRRREKMQSHAFNFVEKGVFEKSAEELRKKQDEGDKNPINLLNLNIRPSNLPSRQPLKLKAEDLIPDAEWWDAYFLPADKKSFSPYWEKDSEGNWIHTAPALDEINLKDFENNLSNPSKDLAINKITHYIQHPVPIKNEVVEKSNKVTLPVFLTEKEKKKLRRLRRLEKEKEKQEQMRVGLIKPPPPKLKFNNFMRILGDQAIQDPSQVEKLVRKAYEERYAKMMKENEMRKLTKEQKADKIKRKFEKDSKKEVRACLFRVEDLTQRKNRFKIDRNSQQLYLTGICIMMKKNNPLNLPSLVYVEGGPLAIKKFKNLMLRRIKWKGEDDIGEDEPNLNGDYPIKKECLLVWEGTLKKRYYEKWKMTEVKNENDVKKILQEKGIDHFWNLVSTYTLDNNQ